ncbi:MAG TPA: outer membrane protein assembly factor BamE [Alphaproteobacteria bacterium]
MKKLILTVTALLTLSACEPVRSTNGVFLTQDDVTTIQPGIATRADVLQALGTPTTTAVFDDNTWYYVGMKTEKDAFFDPQVTDRSIYEVKFDDMGTLASIEKVEGDAIDVPLQRRKTPTSGHDLTFAQQLLGNLGRFNKSSGGGMPGAN